MEPLDPKTPPVSNQPPKEDYPPEHKTHVAPARSFSSDLANAIRSKGGSVVRIAIAEDEKHRREFAESSATSRKNLFFIIASVLIVIGAIVAIFVVYSGKKNAEVTAPSAPAAPSSIVSAEDYQAIDINGLQPAAIVTAINGVVSGGTIPQGTIKNLIITSGPTTRIPANQFLNSLGMHAPSDFLLALSKEYMIGAYNYGQTNSNLFLIIQGTAHDYLLSGMLTWEPKLFADMVPLFNINTAGLTQSQLQSMPFTDMTIENRDTRAVLGPDQKPLFFYSFLDDDTIIMATDSKTLTEVVRRY